MILNLPNSLTISRIVAIPVFAAAFFVEGNAARWVALAIFAAAAVTDFLDGFLARRNRQATDFGRFLDPIADKLLVATALLMLAGFGRIAGFALIAAAIILLREIVVSGLREYLGGLKIVVPVSNLAKWKTAVQMVAISFLIVGDAGPEALPVVLIGEVLLWLAALLTFITGYGYLRAGLPHIIKGDEPGKTNPAE
ncbi:MAG: CDP-diacylglycerol--glycerol-3-phosphate 3-phosphatidyltransferase [Alphaproteobacteria bacterium]